MRGFAEIRTYGAGERLVTSGEPSPGMFVILSGEVAITQHNLLVHDQPIVTHGPGAFIGELAQLSGRPSLVDAQATKPVEALVIPSRRLRDVMVAEAELGERIMRALILRRVGLLESGVAGPVVIGHAQDGEVLRLAGFLARNGHPHHTLDPDTDSYAKTLLDRFHIAAAQLPIVLCPNGQLLRNSSEVDLARCLGLVQPIDPAAVYDVAINERLHKAGADLVSLSEKIDTTSAAGKMVFRMLAVLAEFERDIISERTAGAMQHKRGLGEYTGGLVPYGGRWHAKTVADLLTHGPHDKACPIASNAPRARRDPAHAAPTPGAAAAHR